MKAVLLAGGLGTRMREETEYRPKPMVEVGGRPVLWHIMKHLSTYGIQDFIIATGYKGQVIKDYFLDYGSRVRDFTIKLGNQNEIELHGENPEESWSVTVADTGATTMTGGRIKRLKGYLDDEPFLCTYGDGIADVDISQLLMFHRAHALPATITVARPRSRFGVVDLDSNGIVKRFREKPQMDDWVNMGFFILDPKVLSLIPDDTCVFEEGPLRGLASAGSIGAYKHNGFWQPMDTQRELLLLNSLWDTGDAPWKTW